ncbi:hypothetical protein KVR01_006902 [Diaporthe batatas]|uniref:uncharacterized protein n=1 Tax=Diaporthe batatas TaxID=748121 RepID=UPI001D03BC01|nr:uncharacterized protein KVR01_006902 [Diaporthe batatas]KAG8163605.1 hypothetical protein KVR01_006902 [Diaporthe batatas]
MHTFSPTSTQYEVESWIFPCPGVRPVQDARCSGPRKDSHRHSLLPVIPHARPSGEREERVRLKKGHRRWHSNEHDIAYNDLNRRKEVTANERSLETGRLKTTVERWEPSDQSRHYEYMHDIPSQTVSRSGSRSGETCVRSSELLSAVSSSHQPYKQPGMRTQSTRSTPLPLAGHGLPATQIQLLHPPTYPQQKSTTAHGSDAARSKGLSRSLACKSQAMEAESEPSRVADLPVCQDRSPARADTLKGCREDAPCQQDMAEHEDQQELNPVFLGSLDYHSFLHTPSEANDTCFPKKPPLPGTTIALDAHKFIKVGAASHACNAPRISLNDRPANAPPVSSPSHQVTQSLSRQPFPEIREPVSTICGLREEALLRSGRSEALKEPPRPELSVSTNFPACLTFSTISSSSSLTTTPLLRERTSQCILSSPHSTLSSQQVDPERLQPFIGPLLPQQPPPNQPLPQLPLPSPAKRLDPCRIPFVNMAGQVDGSKREKRQGDTRRSLEQTEEELVNQRKGRGLRKKISRFFSSDPPGPPADATAPTTFQPLSLATSRDSERLSLSEIFDDVYCAARDSLKPGRVSQSSRNSGRTSSQNTRGSVPTPPGDVLFPTRPDAQDSKAASTMVPNSPYKVGLPLMDHPAVKDDLERLQVTGNNFERTSTPRATNHPFDVPGPPLSPRRPAQTDSSASSCVAGPASTVSRAILGAGESHVTVTTETYQDDGPLPAFDRTVDLTWYRTAREQRGTIICSIPRPSGRFEQTLNLFLAQFTKGRPFRKYDGTKRFPYFNLPSNIRFEVVRYLFADTDAARPILLNSERQACPAWPADTFVSLKSVLKPLRATMWACPRLRAEVMVVLLLTRKFHVIFSPFVRECTQPLPTTWLFRYLRLMQDVSLEIDMTKLGFGHRWESALMDPNLRNIRELVRKFTAEILTRSPANSMGSFTIHCRRYFGYRQEPNTCQGRHGTHGYLPVGGEDDERQPHNYEQKSPSLPPSAEKPYSGHLRHHLDGAHRVPYVTEDQLEVASQLRTLTGRFESIRMVGFSEKWTYATHLAMWPEAERNAVSDAVKHCHVYRQTPSPYSFAAPGHAVFLDYGFAHGVHRYPPLPDSEPMVCVDFDRLNGLFVELGSGNVVSVTRNGTEFHGRSPDPPTPGNFASHAFRECLLFVPPASLPRSRCMASPKRVMHTGTPVKAAAVLGLPGTLMTSSEFEHCDTSTKPRPSRAESKSNATNLPARGTRLGEVADQKSRSGSIPGAIKPGELHIKRSFHFLGKKHWLD